MIKGQMTERCLEACSEVGTAAGPLTEPFISSISGLWGMSTGTRGLQLMTDNLLENIKSNLTTV